jgi:hypothetical protein
MSSSWLSKYFYLLTIVNVSGTGVRHAHCTRRWVAAGLTRPQRTRTPSVYDERSWLLDDSTGVQDTSSTTTGTAGIFIYCSFNVLGGACCFGRAEAVAPTAANHLSLTGSVDSTGGHAGQTPSKQHGTGESRNPQLLPLDPYGELRNLTFYTQS